MVTGPVADSVQSVAAAVPPPVFTTLLASVRVAGFGGVGTKVLVIEHEAVAPAASVRLAPCRVPPVHCQAPALEFAGPDSASAHVPAGTEAPVTAAEPVAPEMVTGPVADSVQSVARAVPPPVFTTFLASVTWATWTAPVLQSVWGFATVMTRRLSTNTAESRALSPWSNSDRYRECAPDVTGLCAPSRAGGAP